MAEAIGLASGIAALSVLAIESSTKLFELINSFENHTRNIQHLQQELASLGGVLKSLQETVDSGDIDLSALKLPLLHCGKACGDFTTIVAKCSTSSSSSAKETRTSFRDWFRLKYMGKDVAGFTNLLAGYKATIMIALGDANIRTSKVTAKLLGEYKAMVSLTTCGLEDILHEIDITMRDPALQDSGNSPPLPNATSTEEERASIQQCLKICVEVSSHIDQVQAKDLADISASLSDAPAAVKNRPGLARFITNERLTDCKREIGFTALELKARLKDANRRLVQAQRYQESNADDVQDDVENLLESVKQCLSICDHAANEVSQERVNVFEDVGMGDDGHQVIISTLGDLISARRVTVGSRSTQWLGQMSDTSLQQLSKDHHQLVAERDGQENFERGTHFVNRHGAGHKLS